MDAERYDLNAKVLEHHALPISYFELPDDACEDFNYMSEDEKYDLRIIAYRYGDRVEYLDTHDMEGRIPTPLQGWVDDWISTSFFDGIAIVDHYWNSDDDNWNDECEDDDCYSVIHAWT